MSEKVRMQYMGREGREQQVGWGREEQVRWRREGASR